MIVDREYCTSSFLMYRTIADEKRCFSEKHRPHYYQHKGKVYPVHDSVEAEKILRMRVEEICTGKKTAIALSGGIDSAILAKFMPKGSVAYTFKCVIPGIEVTDETQVAKSYAQECGLEHCVVEIYWEDLMEYADMLMLRKGMPIHSIEVQIYKAAQRARTDGFEALLFGESCDVHYGGMDKLLSRDWSVGEFVERYSFVKPYAALKKPRIVMEPILQNEEDGMVNVFEFQRGFAHKEGMGSYLNACEAAGISFEAPYADTRLAVNLDLDRIRNGESKYLVRELFKRLYPNHAIPPKIPMPRPMNEWMGKWPGPVRDEFIPKCVEHMTGDQKWLLWASERFLNLLDRGG